MPPSLHADPRAVFVRAHAATEKPMSMKHLATTALAVIVGLVVYNKFVANLI